MATVYSDITKDFAMNSLSKDVGVSTDAQAVKDSLLGLLMTNQGERLYRPDIGSDIRKLLFDQASASRTHFLKKLITQTIENYEPRCILEDVKVEAIPSKNEYIIKIYFFIINNLQQQQLLTVNI